MSRGEVPKNVLLRAEVYRAIEERGWSMSELARELGLGDDALNRALGRGRYAGCVRVGYGVAVRIVRALGLDPVDFGV